MWGAYLVPLEYKEVHLDQEMGENTLSWLFGSLGKGDPKCVEENEDGAYLFRNF